MKTSTLAGHCLLPIGVLLTLAGCTNGRQDAANTVVVFVSEDQVFSEPILRDFEQETGIRVQAVFDTEETKSTGVMNRLLAEKANPQSDVFWANEPIRAEYLKQQGIAASYVSPNAAGIPDHFKDPEGYWTGFSARSRPFVVNSDFPGERPKTVWDYTDPRFKGKGVIANPLFGTTTVYSAALFTLWGDDKAKEFFEGLKANDVKISTSNGESADLVGSGEFGFSLVDSDDAYSRLKQGKPIEIIYPDQGSSEIGCLILPNAVVLIAGGPHPEVAKKLIDYLLSTETERKLAFSNAAQIPLHPGVETPPDVRTIESLKTMQVGYAEVARKMEEIQPFLKRWVGY